MKRKVGDVDSVQEAQDASLMNSVDVVRTDEVGSDGVAVTGVLYLHLLEHCIETSARHAHRERMDRLLVEEPNEVDVGDDQDGQNVRDGHDETARLGAELELLEAFLKSHDFRALRAKDADLAGGRDVWVAIAYGVDGSATFKKLAGPPKGNAASGRNTQDLNEAFVSSSTCERE